MRRHLPPARASGHTRRHFLLRQASALALPFSAALAAPAARAQAAQTQAAPWPGGPVRVMVGFAAGGGTDVFARALAQGLGQALGGAAFVVENRPGAGGTLASQAVRQAAPDGHTLLVGSVSTQVIAPLLYARPPYQAGDFTPIAHVADVGIVLVAHPSAPFDNVQQLVRYARQHPGKLDYASGGNGVTNHLAMELLKARTGISLVHIPYRGSSLALKDVLAGQVPLMFDSVASAGPHIRAGKLKALGIAGPARLDALPGLPTLAESGGALKLQDFDVTGWIALYGPRALPAAIVQRLQDATAQVLAQPDVAQRFDAQGARPHYMDSAALAAFQQAEARKWAQAVKYSGARLD